MLATYCTNQACDQHGIAKSVPDELAGAAIDCGVCGEPCVEAVDLDVEAGGRAS